MPDVLTFYLNKIQKLRIDRASGKPAPHKPILLLTVIDLIEQGAIQKNRIEPSPQLVEGFLKYWNPLSNEIARIYLPFFHLKSSDFWHLYAKREQESLLSTIHQFKSMTQLASVVSHASFDEDLFVLLRKPDTREIVRQTIIKTYFPEQSEIIRAVINDNQQVNVVANLLLEQAEKIKAIDEKIIPESPQRSAAFRREIMRLYNYTCAVCRLRIITLDGASAVDAAHIIPFAISHDDGIGNGFALCKLHHWTFDNGLISLDDKYKLIVSTAFEEKGHKAMLLKTQQSQTILLPKQKPYFPSLQSLRWHREKKFLR